VKTLYKSKISIRIMHIIFLYIGIFLGVFIEGEMIMLSSVIAAHHGYLNFWIVTIVGIAGTYGSDCFYFFLGRKKGKYLLHKNQRIRNKAEIMDEKLRKYPILIFIIYRFLYGFRTIAPLAIGTSKTKTSAFLFYSALSTAIWAALYCSLGYLCGELIKSKLGYIEHVEKYIIAVVVLAGFGLFLINRVKNNKRRNDLTQQ
jgi:membrane protein DedA with SNARE-associated domain